MIVFLKIVGSSNGCRRTKAAVSAGKPGDGFFQARWRKLGPKVVGEKQFGIGRLPEHEVADAGFAARADEQIHFGGIGRAEVRGQGSFDHALQALAGVGLLPGLSGLHHVPSPAVVGTDREGDAGVAGGLRFGPHDEFLQHGGKAAFVTHHLQAHAVGAHVVHLFLQVGHEQAHEAGDFFGGALPVFGAEGEQAQVGHAHFSASLDDVAHLPCPGGMPHGRRHEAVFGPTPVAIHDDGNVLR